MGLVAFLIFAVAVTLVTFLAIALIKWLAPAHPDIIDKVLWCLAILIIVVRLLEATGLLGHDIMIPHV